MNSCLELGSIHKGFWYYSQQGHLLCSVGNHWNRWFLINGVFQWINPWILYFIKIIFKCEIELQLKLWISVENLILYFIKLFRVCILNALWSDTRTYIVKTCELAVFNLLWKNNYVVSVFNNRWDFPKLSLAKFSKILLS